MDTSHHNRQRQTKESTAIAQAFKRNAAMRKVCRLAAEAADSYESRFGSISNSRYMGPLDLEMRGLARALNELAKLEA